MRNRNKTPQTGHNNEIILFPAGLPEPVDWSALAGKSGPLHVEIGIGRDTFLIELARADPDAICLGIEYSQERVRRVARKISRTDITSIRLLCCEAAQGIYRFIPPGAVSAFYLFFPDPWPKMRHRKNRFLSPPSAQLLATRLTPEGRFHLKTDDRDLFLYMRAVMEKAPFFSYCHGTGAQAHLSDGPPHQTLYEKKWRRQGKEIHSLVYRRTPEPYNIPR